LSMNGIRIGGVNMKSNICPSRKSEDHKDKAHSTMLFWLRPSKQIRAPLYSMKVRKQRRWMVIKYGIVYAAAASAFAALIVLPIIFRDLLNFTCNFCLEL